MSEDKDKMTVAGLAAYVAYCESRDWKAYNGENLKLWDDVGEDIQKAWIAAAAAAQATFSVEEVFTLLRRLIDKHFKFARMRQVALTQLDLSEAMLHQAAKHEGGSMTQYP